MPIIRVGVQAVTGSSGQGIDFDGGDVATALSLTNQGGESIQYTTGGSWTTVAAGASATVGGVGIDVFRLRRVTAGGYPVPVDVTVEAQPQTEFTSAQSDSLRSLVSGDGNADGAALLRGGFVLAQRGAPASVTGTTAETLLCPAVVVPAGVLGLNGMLRIESAWTSSATLNNRIHTIKIGTTTVFTRTRNATASVSEVPLVLIQNRGSLSSQISITTANLSYGSNLTAVPATLSLDFSVDQSIYFYGQLGNSADTLTLESYNIRLEVAP